MILINSRILDSRENSNWTNDAHLFFFSPFFSLGRPGVDIQARHEPECGAVLHLQFVWNEGTLVSATADDSIHLWNFRSSKKPTMLQSLKFQRER